MVEAPRPRPNRAGMRAPDKRLGHHARRRPIDTPWLAEMETAILSAYTCGRCRQEVELSDRTCPWCGALFIQLLARNTREKA